MQEIFSFNKNRWLIIIVVTLPFIIGFLVVLPKWPYWNFAGNADTWLIFWGTYTGSLGSLVMAIIAFETLKLTKSQNSPCVYPSIELVVQKQYDSQANHEEGEWYNEICYCLRVKNYGVGTATNIRLKTDCSDPELLNNELVAKNINWLNNLNFSLGHNEEKLFYLYPAEVTRSIRRKEKERHENCFDSYIDSFKKSDVIISISYSEIGNNKPIIFKIPISGVITAQTTLIQVLDAINRSIKKLNEDKRNTAL
jgi:hypothetical protein